MIAVVQRVSRGSVTIDTEVISSISSGYVIFLGIFEDDNEKDVEKLVSKITNLRIMTDKEDKMNRSIKDVGGEVLVVSQFTLCADLTAGRRPSFIKAKKPDEAEELYNIFVKKLKELDLTVKTGEFRAMMSVEIINDGPVTIIADSKKI